MSTFYPRSLASLSRSTATYAFCAMLEAATSYNNTSTNLKGYEPISPKRSGHAVPIVTPDRQHSALQWSLASDDSCGI